VRNGIFPSKGRFNLPAAPGQAYSAHRPRQQNFLSEIKSSTATWAVIVCCIVVAAVSIFALMHVGRDWHKADLPTSSATVRFRREADMP
jgi:hypothetical protein